jgi:hypothetical protein
MNIRKLIKFSLIGLALQIVIFVVGAFAGQLLRNVLSKLYWPWLIMGNSIAPSGSAGHALPGGAMLGFGLGVVAYSLLIGLAIYYFRRAS